MSHIPDPAAFYYMEILVEAMCNAHPDDRRVIMSTLSATFCPHCGREQPGEHGICQCENDE